MDLGRLQGQRAAPHHEESTSTLADIALQGVQEPEVTWVL